VLGNVLNGTHARDFCIVVAEDDPVLRYCSVRLLMTQGYRMIEAADGQEALELVEKCNDDIHLLVTNHDMPKLSGAELAKKAEVEARKADGSCHLW